MGCGEPDRARDQPFDRTRHARRSLQGWWVAALVVLAWGAPGEAQECAPPPTDCVAPAEAYAQRARALVGARATPSTDALRFVASHRFAACRARRACLVDDGALSSVERWADAELRAFEALTDEAAREVWRRGLATRVPALWTAAPVAAAPVVPSRSPAADALVLEQLERMRETLAQLDRVSPMIAATQRGLTRPRDGSAPPVCRGELRAQLQAVVREGLSMSASIGDVRRQLDDICERWERWEQPDDRVEGSLTRLVTHLDRVEGWMNDILRCHEPGPYDRRCANTFGEAQPDAVAQARLALREVAAARRALARAPGGRRFPCTDPLWGRLLGSTWTLRTAAAQVPTIGRSALQVCEQIGIESAQLDQVWQRALDTLERVNAQVAEHRRNNERAIENLERVSGARSTR